MKPPTHPLRDRLDRALHHRARLDARRQEANERYDRLSLQVGGLKARLEDEPEVGAVLEALQAKEHQRAVGDYEQLLGLLLMDVLGGEKQVVLDLRTERGLPALDVFLRKGGGMPLEDALHGTGGSVTNVLSAGLRLIALMRSGKRRLLILDESDCWIKPALAARFASVIRQAADGLGIQVVMISHHDDTVFEQALPHRVHLEKGSGGLVAHWSPTSAIPAWADEQAGLRSIELIDFQAHQHTVVPLSPGVTLIQGDNDLGKSAIVRALRAAFYAESNDTFIRHGSKKTQILMDFGPEHVLSWERAKKGRAKVIYTLSDRSGGQILHQSEGARDVPAWVDAFGIHTVDGLDIQLGDQHDPVFLLNKPARERAKALAIGDECGHVQTLLALDKQEVTAVRMSVRQGEAELETTHRTRTLLAAMTPQSKPTLIDQLEAIGSNQVAAVALEKTATTWSALEGRAMALKPIAQSRPVAAELPTLNTQPEAERLLSGWQDVSHRLKALGRIQESEPDLMDEPKAQEMIELGRRWAGARATTQAGRGLATRTPAPVPEDPRRMQSLQDVLARWAGATRRTRALTGSRHVGLPDVPAMADPAMKSMGDRWDAAIHSMRSGQQAMEVALRELNGADEMLRIEFPNCPVCHQTWHGGETHEAVAG